MAAGVGAGEAAVRLPAAAWTWNSAEQRRELCLIMTYFDKGRWLNGGAMAGDDV
jgi:hypothetical protein